MTALNGLDDIEQLYFAYGSRHYGEGVTQIEHALQCAELAETQGAPDSLVVAALLHDIGHLFEKEEDVAEGEFDGRHEALGAKRLADFFPEAVWRPVALHVAAKRYLCFIEPQYWDGLSEASKKSLELQGGRFSEEQARAFERAPYWLEAVQLRRFDDNGKQDEMSGRCFADYLPVMRKLLADVGTR
jgi:phosphonate degradation associated HDIG domain protein